MNNKKRLLNLFTEDTSYNYHLVKTTDPDGHLMYLIKNGSALDKDLLEFYPTSIAEELVNDCSVKIEKVAPSIFFTEENNTEKLKYDLNDKLSESSEFSEFIENIKDEYRILEVKDTLLYKKDPKAYEEAKQKEHDEHQKELFGDFIEQLKEKKKQREDAISAYDSDLIKLFNEYFDSVIEFEKRDFNFTLELDKIVGNLIDEETWIKIDDKPYICRIEILKLVKDRMDVFLTDNNDYSYTATLRLDKISLITENVNRINIGDEIPISMPDYEVLAILYNIDFSLVTDWEYKNETDRLEYVIDYLVPIFKEEKEKRKQEYLDKIKEDEESNIENSINDEE